MARASGDRARVFQKTRVRILFQEEGNRLLAMGFLDGAAGRKPQIDYLSFHQGVQ